MSENENKTEEPTSKRLSKAHSEGQFARAEEIGVVFILMTVFCILLFTAKSKAVEIAQFAQQIWTHLADYTFTQTETIYLLRNFLNFGAKILLGFVAACTASALIAGGLQSGFRLATKALKINWEKLNPVEGLKRIFSFQKLVDLGIDSLKFVAVAVVIHGAFCQIRLDPIFFTPIPLSRIPPLFLKILLLLLSRLIFVLFFIALLKYLYERYSTHQKLKMTREEVKDEKKQSLGNPEIKAAQRRLAQRLLQKQMLDEVPVADVVITNPNHYAVALKYERERDKAPIILAKGENLFAQHIKAIAKHHGVPMVENKMAARFLFRLGTVGKPIPIEVYEMVAEILAYVYRMHKYYFYELKKRRSFHGHKEESSLTKSVASKKT